MNKMYYFAVSSSRLEKSYFQEEPTVDCFYSNTELKEPPTWLKRNKGMLKKKVPLSPPVAWGALASLARPA